MNAMTEIISQLGISKAELSRRYGIPYKTLTNWTAEGPEHRDPPAWVVNLLKAAEGIE